MPATPEQINRAASDVLQGARHRARLTQVEYAQKAGMSAVTVQKLLTGVQSIKVPQFIALARASGIEPGVLLREVIVHAEGMSAAGVTQDELDTKRKQNEARAMTVERIEAQERQAATRDPEYGTPEPDQT